MADLVRPQDREDDANQRFLQGRGTQDVNKFVKTTCDTARAVELMDAMLGAGGQTVIDNLTTNARMTKD